MTTADLGAVDLGGTARLFWTDNQSQGRNNQTLDQQYRLSLRQVLTPYLSLTLQGNFTDLSTRLENGESVNRRSQEPQFFALYNRRNITARLGANYRRVDGSAPTDQFEARGINGTFFWQARSYLSLNLSFRDELNETDVAALGRDTQSRSYRGSLRFEKTLWSAWYDFSRTELRNPGTGLQSDQNRHDLRLQAADTFFSNRLSVSFQGLLGRLQRSQDIPPDADLAEPVPAAQGLFGIEVNPVVGQLEPRPGLIDGDFENPVSPPIDIGGANTFRNLGLDLGITRPITELEISVDRPSGPGVLWEVYQSRDNLFWEPVAGVQARWDPNLLRYFLRFPETENQFFKAVNVSVNPLPVVLVTELRALRAFTGTGTEETDGDVYSADLAIGYRISRRIRAGVALGTRNDLTTVADLVRQDRTVEYANAGLDFSLSRTLNLDLSYRWDDSQDARDPELDRTNKTAGANLSWNPLPTIGFVWTLGTRDELRRESLISSSTFSSVGLGLQLLPELRLSSRLRYSRTEDEFQGQDRDLWGWNLGLQAQPHPTWGLQGGFNYQLVEAVPADQLLRSTGTYLSTNWSPGAKFSFNGSWRWSRDNSLNSLRQTYGLIYTPGPKLTFSATWTDLSSSSGSSTGNDSLSASYRLARRIRTTGAVSRSRSRPPDGPTSEIRSVTLGLTIDF